MSTIEEQERATFIEALKHSPFSSFLPPAITVSYIAKEDLAYLADYGHLLSRSDSQELKRLVDRFYESYTDEEIAEAEPAAERRRAERMSQIVMARAKGKSKTRRKRRSGQVEPDGGEK